MSIQDVEQSDTKNGARSYNKINESKRNAKTIAACFAFITQMTYYQLKRLTICPNGECHVCSNGKEALNVVNHIQSAFKSRGFDCYALDNYVWIVPFTEKKLQAWDVERDNEAWPNLDGTLLEEVIPTIKPEKSRKATFNFKLDKNSWIILAIVVGVLIIAF